MSFLSKSCKLFGAYLKIFLRSAFKNKILPENICKKKNKEGGETFRLIRDLRARSTSYNM